MTDCGNMTDLTLLADRTESRLVDRSTVGSIWKNCEQHMNAKELSIRVKF